MQKSHTHQLTVVERDTVPPTVALDILTAGPKVKHPSALKRAAREARETHYTSTAVPADGEIKLLLKLRLLPIDKLDRLSARCRIRIARLFRAVKKVKLPIHAAPMYSAIDTLMIVDNCARREYLRRVEVQKTVALFKRNGA